MYRNRGCIIRVVILQLEKMKIEKKSNHGGAREGAGRKPKHDYETREMFKMAFDKYITQEEWNKFVKEAWNGPWERKRFLIEQRIGKPAQAQTVDIKSEDTALDFFLNAR